MDHNSNDLPAHERENLIVAQLAGLIVTATSEFVAREPGAILLWDDATENARTRLIAELKRRGAE